MKPVDEAVERIDPRGDEAGAPAQGFAKIIAGPLFGKDDPSPGKIPAFGLEERGEGRDQPFPGRHDLDPERAHTTSSEDRRSRWKRLARIPRPGKTSRRMAA
jgi:hypothetical protein